MHRESQKPPLSMEVIQQFFLALFSSGDTDLELHNDTIIISDKPSATNLPSSLTAFKKRLAAAPEYFNNVTEEQTDVGVILRADLMQEIKGVKKIEIHLKQKADEGSANVIPFKKII